MTLAPPGFTGSPLDRLDHLRGDPDALATLAARSDARLLDLDGYQPRVADGRLGWRGMPAALPAAELALLGLAEGQPRFVHLAPGTGPQRRTPELFAALAGLAAGEAGTYAAARSLLDWHARHPFCAQCGSATAPHRAGWARLCPVCGAEHYPRTDPVVIMLAEHRDAAGAVHVLLGRQAVFPTDRYSALAGFVEVGESVEEAVARELHEEAGVRARDVRYVASQPWPFPSQLMLACLATVDDPALTLDRTELEDAFWASRAEVAAALAGSPDARFSAPPPYAIAHTLLARWAADT